MGQLGSAILVFATALLLTRLVEPGDIGRATMVGTALALALLVGEITSGPALITRTDLDQQTFSTAFWAQVAFSAVAAAALVASTPLLERLYDEELSSLVPLAAATMLAAGLDSIARAVLARDLAYAAIARADVYGALVAGIVAVSLAAGGAGAAAPLAGTLALTATSAAFLWSRCGRRPARAFSSGRFRELARFSAATTGSRVVNYAVRQGDDVGVGTQFGPRQLGFYARGYQVLLVPVSRISGEVGRVMVPALRSISHDPVQVGRGYLRGVRTVSLVNLPLLAIVFVTAPELVRVLFGEDWSEAADFVRIFAIAGSIDSVTTTVGWLYLSMGRVNHMLRATLLLSTLYLGGVAAGFVIGSARAVALGYTIAAVVATVPALNLALRPCRMRAMEVIISVMPAWSIAVLAGGVAAVARAATASLPEPSRLLVAWAAGCAGAGIALSIWRESREILKSVLLGARQ